MSLSTTRPTNVMPGSWPTLMMIRSTAVPEPTTSTRVVVSACRK